MAKDWAGELVWTTDGNIVPAHETLISDVTRRRAQELIAKHPDRVFRVHMMDAQSPKVTPEFEALVESMNIRPQVRPQEFTVFPTDPQAQKYGVHPIKPSMRRAVEGIMAECNMLGVITLVPEPDPEKADISIAAVDAMEGGYAGLTFYGRKHIIFNSAAFDRKIPEEKKAEFLHLFNSPASMQRYFEMRQEAIELNYATHELGHALGLEHPHNFSKGAGGPSVENISCGVTVMAYEHECKGLTIGLRPADIAALKKLYDPEQADGAEKVPLGSTTAIQKAAISHNH